MKNKSTLNVSLLEKVKKHILEEPNRLIMGDWVQKFEPGTTVFDYEGFVTTPQCGTVGCIAGWCVLLSDGMSPTPRTDFSERAARLLCLDFVPGKLFFADSWPDSEKYDEFSESTDPKRRAEIVAEVIDEFIEEHTGGEKFSL